MPIKIRIAMLAVAASTALGVAVIAPAATGKVVYAALEPLRAPTDVESSAPRAFSVEARRRNDLMHAAIRLLVEAAARPQAEQRPA